MKKIAKRIGNFLAILMIVFFAAPDNTQVAKELGVFQMS